MTQYIWYQRTTCRNWFSPSIMWINLRSLGLGKNKSIFISSAISAYAKTCKLQSFHLCLSLLFVIRFHYITQDCLRPAIFLPQSLECWDYSSSAVFSLHLVLFFSMIVSVWYIQELFDCGIYSNLVFEQWFACLFGKLASTCYSGRLALIGSLSWHQTALNLLTQQSECSDCRYEPLHSSSSSFI